MDDSKALEIIPPQGPAVVPAEVGHTGMPVLNFSQEQIELIKRTIAKNTTDDELALFMYTAKARGLNPLLRQIHCVKRKAWNPEKKAYEDVMSIQTGIDGYRIIAQRSGLYDGQDGPDFTYQGNDRRHPATATVKVYRKDCSHPFTATAHWSEYCQTTKEGKPTASWDRMGHVMLGKCAEALALRKAFPEDLAGVYTDAEMDYADSEPRNVTPQAERGQAAQPRRSQKISRADDPIRVAVNQVYHRGLEYGFTDQQIRDLLKDATGLAGTEGITMEQVDRWKEAMDAAIDAEVDAAIDPETKAAS